MKKPHLLHASAKRGAAGAYDTHTGCLPAQPHLHVPPTPHPAPLCAQIGLNDLHDGLLQVRDLYVAQLTSLQAYILTMHIVLFVLSCLLSAVFVFYMVRGVNGTGRLTDTLDHRKKPLVGPIV